VLARHARHAVSGEPLAPELVAKLQAAARFNQAFDTVEFTASALLDMALHGRSDGGTLDIAAFEQAERQRLQMPREIALRHRPAHFLHLFSGPDYAAGYYVYMWASVLDNDGFGAFVEAGDVFDRTVADQLHRHIYAAGNTVEPGETYRRFRGRDPHIDAMLERRGLV
jgi:peptidyl-dipeptidase Dcp